MLNPTWEYALDFHNFYHDDNLTIGEKAKKIYTILSKFYKKYENLEAFSGTELDDIINEFEENIELNDVASFDIAMYNLYDFADSKRIWIKT